MAAPPPGSASRTNPPRTIIQPFCGKSNENVTAWISLAEDAFDTGQVQKNQWMGYAAQSFRNAALSWYHGKKMANNNTVPPWDQLKHDMLDHWAHPARTDKLCTRLSDLSIQGGITEYTRRFQEIEVQIPSTDMTLSDCKYWFTLRLPDDLSMQLMSHEEPTMMAYYTAARRWDSIHRVTHGRSNLCPGLSKPFKRG